MLLFLAHTVHYKTHLVACHSPPSILFNHPLSYLAAAFKRTFVSIAFCLYTGFFSLSFSHNADEQLSSIMRLFY